MSSVFLDGGSLVISLWGEVHAHTVDKLLTYSDAFDANPAQIVVDMSRVKMIKPAGACQIACLVSWLSCASRHNKTPVRCVAPSNTVGSYLATLGFFSVLRWKAGLQDCEDLCRLDQERRQHKRDRDRIPSMQVVRGSTLPRPVVWPMEIIGQKLDSLTRPQFENNCIDFVNCAADKFETAFRSNLGQGLRDIRQFWQANAELFKNTYEHSESWGLATIVARPNYGTVVSYHDIGVGIPTSVRMCRQSGGTLLSDEEALRWSLVEGNTTKEGNSGVGLTIVAEYVAEAKGVIEIRSGTCRLRRSGNDKRWQRRAVPPFVGTHISFYLPVPK